MRERVKRNVRVRDGFSDRNGIKPIPKEMQLVEIAFDSRIVLFNKLNYLMDSQIEKYRLDNDFISKNIVEYLFNDVYDSYRDYYSVVKKDIFEIIKDESYDVVLTTIEYICNLLYRTKDNYKAFNQYDYMCEGYIDVFQEINAVFESEYIGYRFIDNKIVPITNSKEINEINDAFKTPFEKVNESIKKSIDFISVSGKCDYENSIKESIIAVEQLLNILLNREGLTLNNAIEQINHKISIHPDLKNSIKDLYNYASDANGVRHGNNKQPSEITFAEAKLILIICSAVINYFISIKDEIK